MFLAKFAEISVPGNITGSLLVMDVRDSSKDPFAEEENMDVRVEIVRLVSLTKPIGTNVEDVD